MLANGRIHWFQWKVIFVPLWIYKNGNFYFTSNLVLKNCLEILHIFPKYLEEYLTNQIRNNIDVWKYLIAESWVLGLGNRLKDKENDFQIFFLFVFQIYKGMLTST